MKKGLVPEIEGLKLYWSKRPSMATSGQTSKIMRVVIMNSIFDEDDVPDYVLEYCLLYQLGFVMSSIECIDWMNTTEYTKEFKNKYNKKEEAETWLKKMDIQL